MVSVMADNFNAQLRAVNRRLKQSTHPVKAGASSALNKTASRIKSRVVKAVSGDVRVTQKHIRKRVYIRKSTAKTMMAKVTAYRRDIPVISMGIANTRLTRKGSVVRIDGKSYAGAFIADGSAGYGRYIRGRGYQNTTLKSFQVLRRTGNSRYPIEVVKVIISPSVDRHTPKIAREQMQTEYPRIAQHEIDYRMQKYASR